MSTIQSQDEVEAQESSALHAQLHFFLHYGGSGKLSKENTLAAEAGGREGG